MGGRWAHQHIKSRSGRHTSSVYRLVWRVPPTWLSWVHRATRRGIGPRRALVRLARNANHHQLAGAEELTHAKAGGQPSHTF